MISLVKSERGRYGKFETVLEEYRGKSYDEKPILAPDRNGSVFYEMDSKNIFMWDGDDLNWILQ